MLRKGGMLAILYCLGEWIKEKTEPTTPANVRFDWDAYRKDIENGIGAMEQIKKRERGDYYTTKPLTHGENLEDVLDVERYRHDLKVFGESLTEGWRKNGMYKYIKKKK